MEYRSSYERINNIDDIESISRLVCKDYELGNYLGHTIMDIGYEDFNYILQTENSKYFVKIFNTDRDTESCERLIKILTRSLDNNISTPKLYKFNNSYIYPIIINNVNLNLFVMECIDGENLYLQNRNLTLKELDDIANISSKINSINYDIKETFYDEWTLSNLKFEYEKKKLYLEKQDKENIEKILTEFDKVDFNNFKYCYIHGDIIKANLIPDKTGNLYVIDFSVFNYLPRIIEIAVILLGNCLTTERKTTVERINYFLKRYNELNKLEKIEIKSLPIFIKALASMFIVQTSYIKKTTANDYVENEYWLSEGRRAIEMNITDDDIEV
jgi:Ser/Thr protein kinase RdoA (MazF antagonist)